MNPEKFDVDYAIRQIQKADEVNRSDSMVMYARLLKKHEVSLKELAKRYGTDELSLESVLNSK